MKIVTRIQPKTTGKEPINWDKLGIVVALVGLLTTSIFSLIQTKQTQEQIAQTQGQLNEAKAQNMLSAKQFEYTQRQNLNQAYQDSIDDRKRQDEYIGNLRVLSEQAKALTLNNDFIINSQSPDIRVLVKTDTTNPFLGTYGKVFEDDSLYYWVSADVSLENIGNRTAIITNCIGMILTDSSYFVDNIPTFSHWREYIKVLQIDSIIDPVKISKKSIVLDDDSKVLSLFIESVSKVNGKFQDKRRTIDKDSSNIEYVLCIRLTSMDVYTKKFRTDYFSYRISRNFIGELNYIVKQLSWSEQDQFMKFFKSYLLTHNY